MYLPDGSDTEESACNAGDLGSIPELGRSYGEGSGNPLQYSCLENSKDRGDWWATVHGVKRVRHDWRTNTFTFSFVKWEHIEDSSRKSRKREKEVFESKPSLFSGLQVSLCCLQGSHSGHYHLRVHAIVNVLGRLMALICSENGESKVKVLYLPPLKKSHFFRWNLETWPVKPSWEISHQYCIFISISMTST